MNTIVRMDAGVVGLVEIENHLDDKALQDLVNGLNYAEGSKTYASVNTGTIGSDAIKVALIYKTETVIPVGNYAILDTLVDPLFIDTGNRSSLAQTFRVKLSGAKFTVILNHFKFKGSPCDDLGDPNMNDGQGNCNQTRTNAAIALVNWLKTDPTGSGNQDFLILGALNSYAMEDPLTATKNEGYIDLIDGKAGENPYSLFFRGKPVILTMRCPRRACIRELQVWVCGTQTVMSWQCLIIMIIIRNICINLIHIAPQIMIRWS